jgi:hypothetical protein
MKRGPSETRAVLETPRPRCLRQTACTFKPTTCKNPMVRIGMYRREEFEEILYDVYCSLPQ